MTENTEKKIPPSLAGEGTSEALQEGKLLEKWMAFPVKNEIEEPKEAVNSQVLVQRATEWGLTVKPSDSDGQIFAFPSSSMEGRKESMDRLSENMRASNESNSAMDSSLPRVSQGLKDAMSSLKQTFVVSDARMPDCPIMYASAGFSSMTGYSVNEVVGRNCRFLQGPDTDEKEIAKIRAAVRSGRSYCGRILNYKKDGTPFWNLLTLTPIRDDSGNVIKFIGMQVEVSKYTEGLNDKTLRPNALPVSLIRYDERQKDEAKSSITEVVQTVRRPRTHLAATEFDTATKIDDKVKGYRKSPLQGAADMKNLNSPGRLTPLHDMRSESLRTSIRKSGRSSLMGFRRRKSSTEKIANMIEPEILMTRDLQRTESWDRIEREKDIRQAIDLATTLERIEKNFVITDPRLPDNPIIFASDSFLELTEYSREEILGRNCRFLQGPETDQAVVSKIREAIREQKEITVQLINYTKSGTVIDSSMKSDVHRFTYSPEMLIKLLNKNYWKQT